jgi:hypothetical protein
MLHPATLLVAWAGFAFLLPLAPLGVLLGLAAGALSASLLLARRRALSLLRRARWLLLSIAVLFAFATPGLSVPGWPGRLGVTQDGLMLAAEHLARLLILLTSLAVLHEHLRTAGLLTGLHALLAPLGEQRERIVVRLMLVIEFIEDGDGRTGWRHWLVDVSGGPQSLTLAVRRTTWPDWLAYALMALAVGALAW